MRRALVLAALSLLVSPALARPLASDAGGGRAAIDPARELATRKFIAGSAEYADGDYAAALADFEAGYAAKQSPAFLVNIAQCLRRLDRLDEAARAYRRYLDAHSGPPETRLEVFDALEDTLDELNRRIDKLAQDAALMRAFLATSHDDPADDPALRAKTRATLDAVMKELVRIDDGLAAGFGVGRAVVLPHGARAQAAASQSSTSFATTHQRLAATAATRNATATHTSRRSPRSASHSHIAR
jgi:tetratricopeptide (TPR) repeat protein